MTEVDASIREVEALHKEHAQITKKASQFWINVSSSVRPIITYCFFMEWIVLTFLLAGGWIDNGMYELIWNQPAQALMGSVTCFWFGQRTFGKR